MKNKSLVVGMCALLLCSYACGAELKKWADRVAENEQKKRDEAMLQYRLAWCSAMAELVEQEQEERRSKNGVNGKTRSQQIAESLFLGP